MTRLKTIGVTVAAIAGCQVANVLMIQPRAATSSDCLQWAADTAQSAYRVVAPPPPPTAELGYYDVRLKHDVALPSPTDATNDHAQAFDNAGFDAQAATVNDGTGSALPNGMSEAEYQAARNADRSMVMGPN